MGITNLFNRGKKLVEDRGGVDSLKQDLSELKDIATEKGASVQEKFGDAVAAVKNPGDADAAPSGPTDSAPDAPIEEAPAAGPGDANPSE